MFDQKLVEPKKRLGVTIKPQLKSVILVSNNARISRPKGAAAAVDGLDTVMKVEKLQSVVMKGAEGRALSVLPRIVGTNTIERLGRDLVALHRPAVADWAARFGVSPQAPVAQPKTPDGLAQPPSDLPVCESCSRPLSAAEVMYLGTHTDRFGGRMLCYQCQRPRNRTSGVDARRT